MKRVLADLGANLNTIMFGVGCCWLIRGVSLWSTAAAYVVAGCLTMAIAAYPYVRRMRKG